MTTAAAWTCRDRDLPTAGLARQFSEKLSEGDRELLTLPVVLPHLDHKDSTELDELQRKAKDEFVAEGLIDDRAVSPGLP